MSNFRYRNLVSVVLLASFVAGSVSGCALAMSRRSVELAQRDLIGIDRDTLIECAGEPAWAEQTGDREIISYISDNPESKIHKRASTCIARFALRRGVVEHLHYETLAGRLVPQRESCEPIIDDCMQVN